MQQGDVVGAYRLDTKLGAGAFGEVWATTHTLLHGRHALKILDGSLAGSSTWRDRFLAEGRILAQLRHPNVVRVTDVLLDGELAVLVMDLVEGRPLADVIESGPLDDAQILRLMRGLLDGLATVHRVGVVHRDLKPENILVCERAGHLQPVIVDFGIAKVLQETEIAGERGKTTRRGLTMGTPRYMSPEQIESTADVDARSDLFAVGAILYELLTGQPAFDGESLSAIYYRVTTGAHGPTDDLSPAMTRLLKACLAVSPDDRPRSATEMLHNLEGVAQEGPLRRGERAGLSARKQEMPSAPTAMPAPPTAAVEPAPDPVHPFPLWAVTALAAALLFASAATLWVMSTPAAADLADLADLADQPAPTTPSMEDTLIESDPLDDSDGGSSARDPVSVGEVEPPPSNVAPTTAPTPRPPRSDRTPPPPSPALAVPDGTRVEQAWDRLRPEALACVPGALWAVQLEVGRQGRPVEVDAQHIAGERSPTAAPCLRGVAQRLQTTQPLQDPVQRRFRVDGR